MAAVFIVSALFEVGVIFYVNFAVIENQCGLIGGDDYFSFVVGFDRGCEHVVNVVLAGIVSVVKFAGVSGGVSVFSGNLQSYGRIN